MTNLAYVNRGQFRPAGPQSPDQAGMANTPMLALIALVTPMTIWMEFSIVGRIFAPELILIGLLPFLLFTRVRMLMAPQPRMFLILVGLWLASQVLTDLIRDTPFEDYSRGWSKIIFFTLNFCTLYMLLYGSRQRLVLFGLGIALGGFLTMLLNRPEFAIAQPWKFGLGLATIMTVVIVSQWRPLFRIWFVPPAMIFMVGVYSMVVGSRSLAGITILVAMYVLVQQILGRRNKPPSGFSPVRTLLFFLCGVGVAVTMFNAYQLAAAQGHLGEYAQHIYDRQGSGSYGVGAAIEHRDIIGSLPLATVVDVGANVGQFSLLVRALHPEAQIVAFEPLPDAAARYRQVLHGDSRAVLHEAAISPARGTATMHVSASADSSSLLPISERQSELFPGTQEVGTTDVDAGPLDAFVSAELVVPPALLKIDVQGFELEVLRGSLALLSGFAYVYVEASFEALYTDQALFDDVARFLETEGFTEVGRYNMAHTAEGAPIQADFLFRRVHASG